ncbi:MAG TPA: hypothetical protein VFJ58_29085 [Armatimonadota bacterium]|nr:hypothetical protein [Armatimonadota bacterium]
MTRTLQGHGNSVPLAFDETMVEALHMTPETPAHITLHGNALIIAPASVGIVEEELDEAISRLRPRYQRMLENPAK